MNSEALVPVQDLAIALSIALFQNEAALQSLASWQLPKLNGNELAQLERLDISML